VRRFVDFFWIAIGVVLLAGCEGSASGAGTAGAGSARASGDERLQQARREMGLAEFAREEEERVDRSFALGAERLPELPRDVDPDGDALREGLARAAEALAVGRPALDAGVDLPTFSRWVERDYARWLRERGEALRDARQLLARAERGASGEYVVASAVIGLLFARFAEAIASVPLPRVIENDAVARLRHRDAFLRTAAPLWDRAADAFGACASATVRAADPSLARWQRFCDERLESVQSAPRPLD
jgi:hypothetical protein